MEQENNLFNTVFNSKEKSREANNEKEELNKIHNVERCQMKLSLRKKKLIDKIFSKRKTDMQSLENQKINFNKYIFLNNSFINLILKIEIECKEEPKIIDLLEQILYIIVQKNNCINTNTKDIHNIYKFTGFDLINNNLVEKLCSLSQIYFYSPKVILYISKILLFSYLIIINDTEKEISNIFFEENEKLNNSGYFISSDKYIDVYNKILEIYIKKDEKISNSIILFIGYIAKEDKMNQSTLFRSGTLKLIMESIDINQDSKILLETKIWCLSKFEISSIYEQNFELSLQIQKIYIDIFLNRQKVELLGDINKEFDDCNFIYNYLKIIGNTTCNIKPILVENLIKSSLLEFLIDFFINKNPEYNKAIVEILIDITDVESDLGKRLINIGLLNYLKSLITDKTLPLDLRQISFIPISNLLTRELWTIVSFDQKVLEMFCSLLNEEDISPSIFVEISYGFLQLLYFCDKDILNKILDEKNLIQLICKAMKQIIINSSKYKDELIKGFCFEHFCSFILSLLTYYEEDITKKNIVSFQKSGGEEILYFILYSFYEINNDYDDENKKNHIINMTNVIKDKIKDL